MQAGNRSNTAATNIPSRRKDAQNHQPKLWHGFCEKCIKLLFFDRQQL
jgi:hypothetical protein